MIHTPGEWHALYYPRESFPSWHVTTTPSPPPRADLPTDVIARVQWRRDGQDKANAHLIAAAPEMLAALEAVVKADQRFPDMDIPGYVMIPLRVAIAKAKGEEESE